jgi:hypothetical protein
MPFDVEFVAVATVLLSKIVPTRNVNDSSEQSVAWAEK